MQASLEAYRNYMQHGKSFRYAKELRKCNSDMIDLLNKNAGLLNEELAIASTALTEHYTTWRNKWDRHQEVLQPGADDVFAFANDHTFPKQAAAVFEQEYRRLFPG